MLLGGLCSAQTSANPRKPVQTPAWGCTPALEAAGERRPRTVTRGLTYSPSSRRGSRLCQISLLLSLPLFLQLFIPPREKEEKGASQKRFVGYSFSPLIQPLRISNAEFRNLDSVNHCTSKEMPNLDSTIVPVRLNRDSAFRNSASRFG